jgi:cytochrome c oxidase subunit 4
MAEEHETHHHVHYGWIFAALCVCTLLSIAVDLGRGTLGKTLLASAVMGVACVKALLVLLNFMHLRFEGPWKFVLLGPTTVLAMAVPFALAPDITYHYYTVQVPQTIEPQPAHHGADEASVHDLALPGHDKAGDQKSPAPEADAGHVKGRPTPTVDH